MYIVYIHVYKTKNKKIRWSVDVLNKKCKNYILENVFYENKRRRLKTKDGMKFFFSFLKIKTLYWE